MNSNLEPNLILYAFPFFFITIIIEALIIASESRKESIDIKDSITSILLGIGMSISSILTKSIAIGAFYLIYDNIRIFTFDSDLWWIWLLAFFAEDFSYYWFHRESHLIRYFWASHMVHHSSEKYNLTTSLRQTWTHFISGAFIFHLWMAFVGFHPILILIFQQINLLYQYWIHTETIKKLWWPIEYFFNTPSHHRVHHGSNAKYLDSNYAGTLIIWDRIFKTFTEEKEHPVYGLVNNLNSYNPIKIAFNEWGNIFSDLANSGSFKNAFLFVFGKPGWSPDGSRKTATQLKKEI